MQLQGCARSMCSIELLFVAELIQWRFINSLGARDIEEIEEIIIRELVYVRV